MQIEKVKAFNIKEISTKIKDGKFHIHEDREVPYKSLNLWMRRGYNAHKMGVIHVRYPEIPDKKYVFPLYFWRERE